MGSNSSEHSLLALGRRSREEHLRGVDIAFGDLALRVAGLELDVGHRVTGRGLVRERGVSEIVEGAKGLGNAGSLERRL